jgi:hypothetical protein
MGSHDPFDQMKGWESKWQFNSQPLKVGNRPDFLACRWRATYCWKALDDGYNFSLDLILIRGFHTKLWGSKVVGVSTLGISGLPFGNPGTKCHLDVGFVERHEVYYKGEGGDFPQVRMWWVLWVQVCPWFVLTPKMLQLFTNHLVFGFVQVCVSSWCLSLFLVPSRSSSTPLYPIKVLRAKERASTPCTSVIFTLDSYLSLSRSLGARQQQLQRGNSSDGGGATNDYDHFPSLM